jgi:hypothetical protein
VFWDLLDFKALNELKDLIILLKIGFKDVVLEETELFEPIWKDHKAYSILNS